MTNKEMQEIIENVDREHGWWIDAEDLYGDREYMVRVFDGDEVIAEMEEAWIPAVLRSEGIEGKRYWRVRDYYFIKGGDLQDLPLSHFRAPKTHVLNRLREAKRARA